MLLEMKASKVYNIRNFDIWGLIFAGVFKRTDTTKSHGGTSSSVSGGKPAGMAALAATYKGSSGSSGSSSIKTGSRTGTLASGFGHSKSTTVASSSSSTSSTIMSADKRLQLMKKKAAQRKKWSTHQSKIISDIEPIKII